MTKQGGTINQGAYDKFCAVFEKLTGKPYSQVDLTSRRDLAALRLSQECVLSSADLAGKG